ncbi:hypothetical protein AB0B40_31845 [Streptomyces sp. NPDC042638]|uniref:hypothetical protein n=1 Tax=Streptomyces sp. NPDC042638 TaxID=3154333 RepID=UPI0033E8C6F0
MANELHYGDRIHLQNLYQGDGGYLDTNGTSSLPGAKYAVSTATVPNRGPGTGTWEVLSGACKKTGDIVLSGDLIYLRNLYQDDGGYLDVNSLATPNQKTYGGLYDVSTSWGKDRGDSTSRWQIFDQSASPHPRRTALSASTTPFSCGTSTSAVAASWRPTTPAPRAAPATTSTPTTTRTAAAATSPSGRSSRHRPCGPNRPHTRVQ